jgi:hypothetical protein
MVNLVQFMDLDRVLVIKENEDICQSSVGSF